MTKVVYFALPSSLTTAGLEKLSAKNAEFLSAVGPMVSYAKKVTKMANPVSAAARVISVISEFYFGKGATLSRGFY